MTRPRNRRPTFSGSASLGTNIPLINNLQPSEDPSQASHLDERGSSRRNSAEFMPSSHQPRQRRGSRFNSSTLVERWMHRNSTSQQDGLLANADHDDDTHDDFAVGIPIDEYPLRHQNSLETLSLKSKPSTRRSSMDSSIDDVCMPLDDEVDPAGLASGVWPDNAVLDEYAAKEAAEQASAEAAQLVRESVNEAADAVKGGRLRPRYAPWDKANVLKSQSNMRFTYFRDDLPATIHSPSIAGLLQPGQTFENLFPSPTGSETDSFVTGLTQRGAQGPGSTVQGPTPPPADVTLPSNLVPAKSYSSTSSSHDIQAETPPPAPMIDPGQKESFPDIQIAPDTAARVKLTHPQSKQKTPTEMSYEVNDETGPWWLDINCPTEEEMRLLSRTFGIHPLTTEDIILHETREKVELFHNYYFVCFTSYDIKAWEKGGDEELKGNGADDHKRRRGSTGQRSHNSRSLTGNGLSRRKAKRIERLKPLAVFSIVFKTGIITVHYRPTPHTINVRRRIRLLRDYLNVSSDWISYALIDDITDGYGPLISAVDADVQGIEDAILRMHGSHSDSEDEEGDEKKSIAESRTSGTSSTGYREWREKGNMLRWIGESRKRVMSLLSLLSNKADVIKGFAKRVSDHWSGAPRSEIAMYLSDIQDHLVTMTQSLNHYEKLLARSHSNYLAQINIDMTRTNNDMNDVLGKISVLGTIVLPMNIVTGLWGMNVLVPGQGNTDSLAWFWSITIMMLVFGISAYFLVMRFV